MSFGIPHIAHYQLLRFHESSLYIPYARLKRLRLLAREHWIWTTTVSHHDDEATYPAPSCHISPQVFIVPKMGRVPLVAKLGDNVELTVIRHPTRPPHSPPASPWHLPYWSGELELVVSPPWSIGLFMIALGMTILVFSACKALKKRKSAALGEKTRVRLNSYLSMRIPWCNIV